MVSKHEKGCSVGYSCLDGRFCGGAQMISWARTQDFSLVLLKLVYSQNVCVGLAGISLFITSGHLIHGQM